MGVVQNKVQKTRGSELRILVARRSGVPFERALVLAEGARGVIASNTRLSKASGSSREGRRIRSAFPCWTGTMTAYVEPGKKLGTQVEYVDPNTSYRWVFPVPEAHQDRRNAILVVEHPDYNLEVDGRNRVVHASTVDLVSKFPKEGGWYLADPEHGIPTGKRVNSDQSGSLARIVKRVGPVARGYIAYNEQAIFLSYSPSGCLGVVIEILRAANR